MGPAQGRRACGAPGPLPLRLKPRGEQGVQRPPHGPDTPGVPFRGGGGHSRAPREAAGAAGLGACEQSPHAVQHGEKKARPPHCIRGHRTLAGQNARHTGHPPTLAPLPELLPFPRNASITSAPGGGFSLLLIANDFSSSPPPLQHAALPLLHPAPGAPRKGRLPPRAVGVPRAPSRTGWAPDGDKEERGSARRSHPVVRRARGCRGRWAGGLPAAALPPPAPRGRGVRTSSIQVATILLMKGWMSFWTHLK